MRRTWELPAAFVVVSTLCQLALMAQAPAPPKPTEAHQRLAYFVGKWANEGELKPGPMGPGGKISSTDTCEWFEGRFAVVCRYDGKTPAGPMKGMAVIGYSPEAKGLYLLRDRQLGDDDDDRPTWNRSGGHVDLPRRE